MFKQNCAKSESLELLDSGSSSKDMIQHWAPQSLLDVSSHQQQGLNKATFSKDAQMIFSMNVERPQRGNWTSFGNCTPFIQEQAAPAGAISYINQVKPDNISKVNYPTRLTDKQSFWNENPFLEPCDEHFGKSTKPNIKTSFTINHEAQQIVKESDGFFCETSASQHAPIAMDCSAFDPLNTSVSSSQPQRPASNSQSLFQQSDLDFQELFDDLLLPPTTKSFETSNIVGSSADEEVHTGIEKEKKKKKKKNKKTKRYTSSGEKKNKLVEPYSSNSIPEAPPNIQQKQMVIANISPRTEALKELFRGTAMLKFPRRGRAPPHFKFVQLTRSKCTFYVQWFSDRKSLKTTTIALEDIKTILQGKDSNVVKRFCQLRLELYSFSIIYNKKHSLDLVAKSVEECTMWVKCLGELIKRARNNQKLTCIQKVWIKGLKYIDTNRPKRELKNYKVVRANKIPLVDRKVNILLQKRNVHDVQMLRKRYRKLNALAKKTDVRSSPEYVNLMLSLAAIDDRLDELVIETRDSRDPMMSKRDISRSNVDLQTLEEKTKVLRRNNNFHLL